MKHIITFENYKPSDMKTEGKLGTFLGTILITGIAFCTMQHCNKEYDGRMRRALHNGQEVVVKVNLVEKEGFFIDDTKERTFKVVIDPNLWSNLHIDFEKDTIYVQSDSVLKDRNLSNVIQQQFQDQGKKIHQTYHPRRRGGYYTTDFDTEIHDDK